MAIQGVKVSQVTASYCSDLLDLQVSVTPQWCLNQQINFLQTHLLSRNSSLQQCVNFLFLTSLRGRGLGIASKICSF